MSPKRFRLPHTFPHQIVFTISLVLCICACGSIVTAVIAWSNYLWGYYLGTGFWSGAVILLAGMFGIVASYVRSICAVKTFMIISIFGCLTSLGMIALAAGGLDPESGFYSGFNKTTFMTHVVHSVYLGLGVLQLSLGVLSDGICIYYLFIERNAELYCAKSDDPKKGNKKRGNIRRQGKDRSSTGSQVPLVGDSKSSKRKNKDQKEGSLKRKPSEIIEETTDENEIFPIPYTATGLLDREALLRQEMLMSKVSPLRNTPYTRSTSFSTFGRIGGPDRESLVVHPTDDNASVADTVASVPQSPDDECHYAQTMLFGPPLPIEEDEALPPYEVLENTPFRKKPRRGLKRPKSEELNVSGKQSRRPNSVQEREKRNSSKRSRNSQTRAKIPQGQNDYVLESGSLKRPRSKHSKTVDEDSAVLRLSKSEDLLTFEEETEDRRSSQSSGIHEQGKASQDFTHSSELIRVLGQEVLLRHKRPQSQTLRINRVKRSDRRRKALSAEVKPNKDYYSSQEGLLTDETCPDQHTSSLYGSNPSLFASNRIRSTKFSLRTPVRRVGMPHVCAPVPVMPIVTVPRVSPPPKPPRNYSVTADDLKDLGLDTDGEVEQVFAGINGLNDATNNEEDDVFAHEQASEDKQANSTERKPTNVAVIQESRILPPEKVVQTESKVMPTNISIGTTTSAVPLSPEVKLDSSPVLKLILPNHETKTPVDNINGTSNKYKNRTDFVSIDKTKEGPPVKQPTNTMVLPTSPTLRSPPVAIVTVNKVQDQRKKSQNSAVSVKNGSAENSKNKLPKPNNSEVIYAKVVKESPKSPVSPTSSVSPSSPTSPTSPSAKVQKARRLTYTFKDKDVSVFDPIGNNKETKETAEIVESVSVKYPVESPKETSQTDKHNAKFVTENHAKIELGPSMIMRMPPLSPSEKILRRNADENFENKRDISPSKEDRPVIVQPANTVKDFNKNTSGAKPKTSFKGIFAPLVPLKQSHGNKTDLKQKETDRQPMGKAPNGAVKLSPSSQSQPSHIITRNTSLPPISPKPSIKSIGSFNKTTSSVPSSRVQTMSSAKATAVATVPTSAVKDVPVNRVQARSMSQSVSQGVLRLPQSQYSRQVPDNVQPPPMVMDIPAAAGAPRNINIPQNNAQQNNDDQSNRSLFSVVL